MEGRGGTGPQVLLQQEWVTEGSVRSCTHSGKETHTSLLEGVFLLLCFHLGTELLVTLTG